MIIDGKEGSLKLQRYYIVIAERSSAGRMVPVQIFHLFPGEKKERYVICDNNRVTFFVPCLSSFSSKHPHTSPLPRTIQFHGLLDSE